MLYNWLLPMADQYPLFNLLNYISFRASAAVITALILSFLIGPVLISWLKSKQHGGQPIHALGPSSHFAKKGTPTMGGVLILLSLLVSSLLWADINNRLIWMVLILCGAFGLIGAFDDMAKIFSRSHKGVSAKRRLAVESAVALCIAWWLFTQQMPDVAGGIALPFVKGIFIQLGWMYIFFAAFVIVGTANAVNLTDGLDGLAIVPAMMAVACYAVICWLAGNIIFSHYLQIPYVPGAGELTIFCAAFIGAGLGFLWFNAPPARVFMGDTGSLAVGAALGGVAVISRHELMLVIIGGLFVLETASVIVQIVSFRLTGRRVFRMAPLHHHFEERGWPEATVVIRFWIISAVLSLAGLAALKIR